MMFRSSLRHLTLLLALPIVATGCTEQPPGASTDVASDQEPLVEIEEETIAPPAVYEVDAQGLLAAALPEEQLADGWIRLFDGQSLFGWSIVGNANWRVEDGSIQVDRGEPSFLATNVQLADCELKVDFRCDPMTNSGIFLRTGLQPENVAEDCLELNIAPPDNPFPTGSFVGRKKLEPELLGEFDPADWHTYHVRMIDNQVEVFLDGKPVMELDDKTSSHRGHISLQHNQGAIEFRNVLLRPVAAQTLKLDADWKEHWTQSEKEENTFTTEVTSAGLKLTGGLGQLQSKDEFGDFVLQAKYTLARPDVNSGIFFRCIRDAMLDGYECQINHALIDGDPLRPADAGAGAIFRRQPARIVIGDGTQPTFVTLLASGSHMATWINGVQVTDFTDTREPDENPRRGLRTAPGPIAIQSHDADTEVTCHHIEVSQLR